MVRVYSKPACVQCVATYRKLNELGVEFEMVDISVDESALEFVRDLGYQQVPVVVVADTHWGGYQPDRLTTLA